MTVWLPHAEGINFGSKLGLQSDSDSDIETVRAQSLRGCGQLDGGVVVKPLQLGFVMKVVIENLK